MRCLAVADKCHRAITITVSREWNKWHAGEWGNGGIGKLRPWVNLQIMTQRNVKGKNEC